jgi:hypothetical protein
MFKLKALLLRCVDFAVSWVYGSLHVITTASSLLDALAQDILLRTDKRHQTIL